ncbi:MAG: hypothetical protein Q8N30_15665 [Methylococcales bacterium]|nr:hypothetical protein [Methylococcales bacterium]
MFIKILVTLGIILTAIGTILLWLGSSSGYAPSFYGNNDILNQLKVNNFAMSKRQKIAIGLIIVGSIMQLSSIWFAS